MSDDAHDIGAEQALLGSVLRSPDVAAPGFLAVTGDHWYRPRHREIAAVIGNRLRTGKPVDPELVLIDLLALTGFGADTGPYLITLMQRAWHPEFASDYADRIIRCSARRNLAAAAIRIRQRLDQSWVNGWDEPISEFTADLKAACEEAEQADIGIDEDQPSLGLDELLAGTDEYNWLVPGLLERGERIILTGSEGLGKSWLVSQFASCLAAGLHPFTGLQMGDGSHRLRVLVVDCENGVSQSRRRFRRIASRLDRAASNWHPNLRLEIKPNGLDLLGADAAWLERKVAVNAPDLLVIGPLYRLHLANMNDETPARELVRVVDGIRTRYGCAVISEAHPGHSQDHDGTRKMRPAGTSLFLRWPEFGFGLARAKGADGEHPTLVDVVAWRGSREERQWPKQLRHGSFLPWEPADRSYWEEAA
jgi:hypothetical protein